MLFISYRIGFLLRFLVLNSDSGLALSMLARSQQWGGRVVSVFLLGGLNHLSRPGPAFEDSTTNAHVPVHDSRHLCRLLSRRFNDLARRKVVEPSREQSL